MAEETPAQWRTEERTPEVELLQGKEMALPVQSALEPQASDALRLEAVLARSLLEMEPTIRSIAQVPSRDILFPQATGAEKSTAAAARHGIS